MKPLKPVEPGYAPRYPRELTEVEIRELLRPCLLSRFSKEALIAGALAAGTALGPSPAWAQDPPPALPKAGTSTRADAKFRAEVFALLQAALPKKGGSWGPHALITAGKGLEANPVVKYPQFQVHFGNSYIGIFDTESAKAATLKLFKQYGIELKKDVTIKGDGYEFVADGYNEKLKIGFELVMPEGMVGMGPKKFTLEPAEKKLDAAWQRWWGKKRMRGRSPEKPSRRKPWVMRWVTQPGRWTARKVAPRIQESCPTDSWIGGVVARRLRRLRRNCQAMRAGISQR